MNELNQRFLLLRGLGREAAYWGDFVPLMQKSFPHSQVITLDLPGTGQFRDVKSPLKIETISEFVREKALKQNLLQQPVTLIALSLGGMVAWHWLKTYPQDCKGACLINSSFANLNPFYQRLRWQSLFKIIQILAQTNVIKREAAIVRLISNNKSLYEKTSKEWANIQLQRPISSMTVFKQLIAAARFCPDNIKPVQPVLLLNAKGDRLVSPACSQNIAKKYAVDYCVHEWGGHDLNLDDGDWVIAQLQEWLANQN